MMSGWKDGGNLAGTWREPGGNLEGTWREPGRKGEVDDTTNGDKKSE